MSEKNESRDWELTCDHCNGCGRVIIQRQVAERKTDVQEFKEECECCEGRGFTIAFEDIPGIAEYVRKSRPASSAPGDAQDERQADEEQPYGWLYDWTHSSATGRPDEQYTGFTKDEAHAKKNDNPRAVYLAAPAAGDALQFLADTDGAIESLTLGGNTRYRVWWPYLDERQAEWFASPLEAVDAALAAQVPQQGEA